MAAVVFHVAIAITICALGRFHVMPATFDANGIAISFAPDGIDLREEASALTARLTSGDLKGWLQAPSPSHLKLYSICFLLLGPLFGTGILSAEPLNLLCYLAILILIFRLGQRLYSSRVGLIAAAAVSIWPTFLLHTTQLLKDPLFIAGMLGLLVVIQRLLDRKVSWRKSLGLAAGAGLLSIFLWKTRDNMAGVPMLAAILGLALLFIRQLRAKHWAKHWALANLAGMTLVVVFTVGVPLVVPKFHPPQGPKEMRLKVRENELMADAVAETSSQNPVARIVSRIGKVRQRFVIEYPNSGSNIDSEVKLDGVGDLVRFFPRAVAIGFFAPFPNMWLATGDQVGAMGRRISGIETVALYIVEALAIVGVCSGRRRVSVWWLSLVAVAGIFSLGLVVVNVGALYRLRYVFVILLIILAAAGLGQTLNWFKKKRGSVSTST